MTVDDGKEDLEMRDVREHQDWFLEALVDEANMRNAEFVGITLQVGGATISGMLVGRSEYFRGVSLHFRDDDEIPEDGTWGAWLLEKSSEKTYKEGDELEPAKFIHLRDARIFEGSSHPVPSNEGVWWRGRISSVDGFWFGRLKGSDPSSE
jgi:hypothetical protein